MKTLYLDVFSGISGDMFIGALLDLGVDAKRLDAELRKLKLEGYHLHVRRGQKASISGTKFDVHVTKHDDGHEHHDHEDEEASEIGRVGHGGQVRQRVKHESEHSHTHHGHHEHEHGEHEHEEHEHQHGHEHEHEPHHDVHGEPSHHHGRTFREIRELISTSELSEWVKGKSIAVFERIAIAEGKIHGLPSEEVHFHE